LPRLPRAVPMKAKLGQNARDFVRLLLRKLNPSPFADNRQFKESRSFTPEQR